jgi:hypothetical protein
MLSYKICARLRHPVLRRLLIKSGITFLLLALASAINARVSIRVVREGLYLLDVCDGRPIDWARVGERNPHKANSINVM